MHIVLQTKRVIDLNAIYYLLCINIPFLFHKLHNSLQLSLNVVILRATHCMCNGTSNKIKEKSSSPPPPHIATDQLSKTSFYFYLFCIIQCFLTRFVTLTYVCFSSSSKCYGFQVESHFVLGVTMFINS